MPHPINWHIEINRRSSIVLSISLIVLFLCYESLLFLRLTAYWYLQKGVFAGKNAASLPRDLAAKRLSLYKSSLRLLDKSIRLNPYNSVPYFEAGAIISEVGDDPELYKFFDIHNAVKERADKADVYDLARRKYTDAIMREPTNAIYHLRLGSTYDRLLSVEEAESEFKKMILLDQQNLRIRLYLSRYLLSKGKNEEAALHLEKIAKLFSLLPAGPVTQEALLFFKSLGREEVLKK